VDGNKRIALVFLDRNRLRCTDDPLEGTR